MCGCTGVCVCLCVREAVKAEPGAHTEGRTCRKRKQDAPGPERSPVGRVTGAQRANHGFGTQMKPGCLQFHLRMDCAKERQIQAQRKAGRSDVYLS